MERRARCLLSIALLACFLLIAYSDAVFAQRSTPVTVVNTYSNPVPVQQVVNEPIYFTRYAEGSLPNGSASAVYDIPEGYRAMITDIVCYCYQGGCYLFTLPLNARLMNFPQGAQQYHFVTGLYTLPGERVVYLGGNTYGSNSSITISGYLIPE